MVKQRYIIYERDDAQSLLSLASRLLSYSTLDQPASVLFRFAASIWSRPETTWPELPDWSKTWLNQQEFTSLSAYWWMAVETAETKLCLCVSTSPLRPAGPAWPDRWQPSSITEFLADAEEQHAGVEWIL